MARQPDELDQLLRAWGHAQVNRYAHRPWERSYTVLAKQRDFGVKNRADDHEPVGRDGFERRAYMAQRSGVKGLRAVPMWAVDPVRSANDADPPSDIPAVAVDMGVPDDLRWIDSAVSKLFRENRMRGLCLIEWACGTGTPEEKAKAVAAEYGGTLKVKRFQDELRRAKDFIRGSKAA